MRERKIIINKIIGGEIVSIKDLENLFQSIKKQPIDDQQLLKIKVNIWRSPDNLKNYILLRRENSELFGALFLRRSTLASGHSTFFNGLFSGFEVKASDPLDLAFYESVNVSGKYLLAWLDFLNHRKVDSIISSDKKLLLSKMGDRSWLQSQLEPQLKSLLESQLQRLQQLKLPLESQIQLQVLTSTLEKELEKLEKEGGILNRFKNSNIIYDNTPLHFLLAHTCANSELDKIIPRLNSDKAPHLKANQEALNKIIECMESDPEFAKEMVAVTDYYGKGPILLACMTGNEEIALRLIPFATKEIIDQQAGPKKRTALHIASILGLVSVRTSLIDSGANQKLFDEYGHEPGYYWQLEIVNPERSKNHILEVLEEVNFFYGHQFSEKDKVKVVDFFFQRKLEHHELDKSLSELPDGNPQCVIS